MDPWDESLKPYLVKPKKLACSDKFDLFYFDYHGILHVNESVAMHYNILHEELNCAYQPIKRLDGDSEVVFADKVRFSLPTAIKSHVFRITCHHSMTQKLVYDMTHFNPFWNEYAKLKKTVGHETPSTPSVLLLGLDSVSRSHATRNLPKSLNFLRNEMGAYDFVGYRKVGENTYPNLVALLTGKSHSSFPFVTNNWAYADSLPFLWKEPFMKSVATVYSEDRAEIAAFNYIKRGFEKVPTDYYFRPYNLALHKFQPVLNEQLPKPDMDCYGYRNYFELLLQYFKCFLQVNNYKRKFGIIWSNQVAHEEFTALKRGDESLLEFLTWMKNNINMQNTILVILSDHGYRIGGASLTHIGREENNNPWLMMIVPPHLKSNVTIERAIRKNTQRLITPFDLYQTIYDILKYGNVPVPVHGNDVKPSLTRRNLFHPIPSFRTCTDAGIPDYYCTCHEKTMVANNSELVKDLAKYIVQTINEIVSANENSCATFTLLKIREASVVYSPKDKLNIPTKLANAWTSIGYFGKLLRSENDLDQLTGRYNIMFMVSPGDAVFDGLVDFSQFSDDAERMTIIGQPTRLDRYGNQSHCVDQLSLKPYCYCTDLIAS
ncbi:uncharacterized protein LOC127872463 [Dreissena polymorpha]|nr:uncharacterized protein LOC127872463 [Dreissena polymorpha]